MVFCFDAGCAEPGRTVCMHFPPAGIRDGEEIVFAHSQTGVGRQFWCTTPENLGKHAAASFSVQAFRGLNAHLQTIRALVSMMRKLTGNRHNFVPQRPGDVGQSCDTQYTEKHCEGCATDGKVVYTKFTHTHLSHTTCLSGAVQECLFRTRQPTGLLL